MVKIKNKEQFILIAASLIATVVFVVYMLIPTNWDEAYKMDGPSMEPTIANGQKFKIKYVTAETIKHGDIIVFRSPDDPNRELAKRVVGLPGDTVTIKDGRLIATSPDKSVYQPVGQDAILGDSSTVVKSSSFYVLGDNFQNSYDSRIDSFGQVPFENLKGIVVEY